MGLDDSVTDTGLWIEIGNLFKKNWILGRIKNIDVYRADMYRSDF